MEGRTAQDQPSHILRAYQERLADLEIRNESLSRMVNDMAEQLGRFSAFIEMLGYDWDPETGEVGYDPAKDMRRK